MTKAEIKNEEERWRTERDFDTLMEYQKLIKDPERLKKAKEYAKTKQNELAAVLKTNSKKED